MPRLMLGPYIREASTMPSDQHPNHKATVRLIVAIAVLVVLCAAMLILVLDR